MQPLMLGRVQDVWCGNLPEKLATSVKRSSKQSHVDTISRLSVLNNTHSHNTTEKST